MSRLMNELRAPQLSDAEPGQTLLMRNSNWIRLENYPQETQKGECDVVFGHVVKRVYASGCRVGRVAMRLDSLHPASTLCQALASVAIPNYPTLKCPHAELR